MGQLLDKLASQTLESTEVPPTQHLEESRLTLIVSSIFHLIFSELAASEEDERYRYLLKNGIVRRVEDEDKIIFAELPQIPGVLVVYRKPSERNANPDRLNLDKRDLTHMPLLEGEERLRLLNL